MDLKLLMPCSEAQAGSRTPVALAAVTGAH